MTTETTETTAPPTEETGPRQMLAKVLGRAAHPKALDRLVEIWPHAFVEVEHDPHGYAEHYDGRLLGRKTRVTIYKFPPGAEPVPPEVVEAIVRPHYSDHYVRVLGTKIAFSRCLKELSLMANGMDRALSNLPARP